MNVNETILANGVEKRTTAPRSQGAEVTAGGVRYRTWCKHDRASVLIVDRDKNPLRTVELEPDGGGYFRGLDPAGAAGDFYFYKFGDSQGWPDPASRAQPFGVHGPSMVIDPGTFEWSDHDFTAQPYSELIIYELHIGTFTGEGTFRSAIEKLDHIVALGANAIELMPVGDFSGERNWGYDGVALYAPAHSYGSPDDLRALVDAAHARALTVVLDVVYNHLGPEGNYLGVYHGDYFNPKHQTPWGAGLNFEAAPVRDFFAENATYWMREFHLDGFRLDATHAILDSSERHILAEIAQRVHAQGGFLVAEDERNEPRLLRSQKDSGLGLDGAWSDDFHHVVRVMLTQEREGYYENFHGTTAELAETLQHGWLFRGQRERADGQRRGGETHGLRTEQFVYCISNHDQVGNRAFGERLGHVVAPASYRAASALLCLVPHTPMLFMGQEWNVSTPFQFFTDHNADLGRLVTQGRRREFRPFAAFRDPQLLETIPDPQAQNTFANSKLPWDELAAPAHAGVFQLYREFLQLRQTHPAFRERARESWKVAEVEHGMVALLMGAQTDSPCLIVIDLVGAHASPDIATAAVRAGAPDRQWTPLLSSNELRFGAPDAAPFALPTTAVFEAA